MSLPYRRFVLLEFAFATEIGASALKDEVLKALAPGGRAHLPVGQVHVVVQTPVEPGSLLRVLEPGSN